MSEKLKIAVAGASGKMGSTILRIALSDADLQVVGAIESKDNNAIGMDIGEIIGSRKTGIIIGYDLEKGLVKADVLIEFTNPSATLEHLEKVVKMNKRMVIGTTGFSEPELNRLKELAKNIPVVFSPNMSIGVNIFFKLVAELSKVCPDGFDIEIFEAHHRFKKDSPSGTAKKLAEIISKEREIKINKIPVHAIRGGDIVGEHTVSFIGMGERIELIHKAHSRETFARGSILAAKFVARGVKPGIYEMKDVLRIC